VNLFLQHIAENAPEAGIENVQFQALDEPVIVRADEYSLEDVVTHILNNAQRYRPAGSPILIQLSLSETAAQIAIHNQGPAIDEAMLETIFEYGVSDQLDSGANGNRGQGLFVAKTYMAKMGGTVTASNVQGGVVFSLNLQRVFS